MAYYITTTAILENRISAAVVKRIYDDNNDGTADTNPVTQLIVDAEARFEGYCRGIYDLAALRAAHPAEAVRMCLDIAEALACKRFPKAATREWLPLWQASEAELKALRKGETRLDIEGSPEPAANEGGDYYEQGYGLADEDSQPSSYTRDGFGSF